MTTNHLPVTSNLLHLGFLCECLLWLELESLSTPSHLGCPRSGSAVDWGNGLSKPCIYLLFPGHCLPHELSWGLKAEKSCMISLTKFLRREEAQVKTAKTLFLH